MRRVFSPEAIKKILNNSISKVNTAALMNAKKQTRLNFPGFDLGEEDIQQPNIHCNIKGLHMFHG